MVSSMTSMMGTWYAEKEPRLEGTWLPTKMPRSRVYGFRVSGLGFGLENGTEHLQIGGFLRVAQCSCEL